MNIEQKNIDLKKFSRTLLDTGETILLIGSGNIGGKASGLNFIKNVLDTKISKEEFPKISLDIPRMFVLGSDIFDDFMHRNNLTDFALNETSDIRIINEFLKSNLPPDILGELRTIIENVKVPLAIRSSSILEDALHTPFAGIYGTKMIPNNQPSYDVRFNKLIEAIKYIFASTYFNSSKDYFKATTHRIEDEKMAVIIQEIVGENRNNRFYPTLSGVAKSFNFYPTGKAKPENGVVNLALGLGKTIVDGGIVWTYSPAFPKSPPPFGDPQDIIKTTQNNFWAVNLNPLVEYDPTKETEFMINLGLKEADYDNVLKLTASTYDNSSNRIVMGVGVDGPRILNFSPLLVMNEFRFNDLIKKLLIECENAFSNPVEIEFAAYISKDLSLLNFGFLQIRPMVVSSEEVELKDTEMFGKDVLVSTNKAMGNGIISGINEIIFVKPENFDKKNTPAIALEIDSFNRKMVNDKKQYLLIGFGRWGSSDPWLGIPVEWSQISGAKIIVESTLFGINVELSQGSHFFHNLSSFNVCYFSINYDGKYKIDWEWLNNLPVISESEFIKHVKLNTPLIIKVDGRKGKGLIKKC
jgi:phosphoenolpyruvate synthase/pyruvate phosphate dikinase